MRCFFVMCAALLLAAIGSGCSGRLECSFVSTNITRISVNPTNAKAFPFKCSECYWWIDSDGMLNIAAKGVKSSLLGTIFRGFGGFDSSFLFSMVLGEPSQGVGKDFRANWNTVRGLVNVGPNTTRVKSTYGITGIEHRDGGIIEGAYRINVVAQGPQFLGGWKSASSYLIFGTFRAIRSSERGSPIRVLAEKEGYDRAEFFNMPQKPSKPSGRLATQPVTRKRNLLPDNEN